MTLEQMANLLGLDCNEVETIVVETGIGKDLLDKPTFADYMHELSEQTGYKCVTKTFAETLTDAESKGTDEVYAKYVHLLNVAGHDYKMLTELSLIVNWLSWYHAEVTKDAELSRFYSELYYDCDEYVFRTLQGEELNYYITTLD